MATRRGDPWLLEAGRRDTAELDGLLSRLTDCSAPKLQARFELLATWPRDPRIAEAAASFFRRFPLRFREQLGTGNAAVGCALLHHASPDTLEPLEPTDDASEHVEQWREAVVEALRAALGPRLVLEDGATQARLPDEPGIVFHQAWLERASSAKGGDLPSLLERLGEPPATRIVERAIWMARLPRTPAIADAAAELVRRPPVRLDGDSPLAAVAAILLASHGDGSHEPAVRGLQAVPGFAWLELASSKAPAEPRARKPVDVPDSEGAFHRWLAEAPAELDRRRAFADWLLEQGKPLGEFMSLQLAAVDRALTAKERRRVQALQNKHERTWLRALWPDLVRDSVVFEGGVVAELCIASGSNPVAEEPQLATVERLRLLGASEARVRSVLSVERLPSLRELVVNAKQLALVPAGLLSRLSSLGVEARGAPAWASVSQQVDAMHLPKLETFRMLGSVRAETAPVLGSAKWVRGLARLVIDSIEPDALWNAIASLQLSVLEVRPDATDRGSVVWTFAHQPDGWSLTLKGELPSSEAAIRLAILEPLDRLDPGLRARTRFAPADRVEKRVRGWLEHRGVALED